MTWTRLHLNDTLKNRVDIINFCINSFGKDSIAWNEVFMYIDFKHEEDITVLKLKYLLDNNNSSIYKGK